MRKNQSINRYYEFYVGKATQFKVRKSIEHKNKSRKYTSQWTKLPAPHTLYTHIEEKHQRMNRNKQITTNITMHTKKIKSIEFKKTKMKNLVIKIYKKYVLDKY